MGRTTWMNSSRSRTPRFLSFLEWAVCRGLHRLGQLVFGESVFDGRESLKDRGEPGEFEKLADHRFGGRQLEPCSLVLSRHMQEHQFAEPGAIHVEYASQIDNDFLGIRKCRLHYAGKNDCLVAIHDTALAMNDRDVA